MINIEIQSNGQVVSLGNTISDSVKFEKIHFSFPESWNGYTKKAVFKNGDKTVNIFLNGDETVCTGTDECFVPNEVIKAPEFSVSVLGVMGDSRATSAEAVVIVTESGYTKGDFPIEPTPSEYEQLLNISEETRQIARSVRDDADNGNFKGEKGDKGPKGEKGDTGEQGLQGIQGEKGEKGEKGNTGSKGDKGDKGDPFTYTDFTAEQLEGLKGPKGDTGDAGPQGVQGLKGEQGDKGQDGYTPQKGVDYFTEEDIADLNIPSVDQSYSSTSENAQSGLAVAQAVSPIRQTITIDTPVWKVQPTIEGTLNENFKTWDVRPYFVTIKNTDGTALEGGKFKLTTTLNGYESAIDQIFTLDNSSLTLSENYAVDFKSISSDRTVFEMRNAGVGSITFNTKNLNSQRYLISAYQSVIQKNNTVTKYIYLSDSVGYSLTTNIAYYSPIGTYNGYAGFLFRIANTGDQTLFKIGYRVEAIRTKHGFVTNFVGLKSTKESISQYCYSDISDKSYDFTQKDLSYLSLGNGADGHYYGNGTVITLEEFA